LTLEAAMLRRGGFQGLSALDPADAIYLKLGGVDGGEVKRAGGGKADIRMLAEKHFAELQKLLDDFAHKHTPYLSRPFPKFASRFAEYDHLARVKEWSTAGGEDESGDAP
jgi:ATP-dependent helicase/nuclease subunit B